MPTAYGSYVGGFYRARAEITYTNSSATQVTINVATWVEVADGWHDSASNFSGRSNPGNGYGSWTAGDGTYLSGPASQQLVTKSYTVSRTHARQSVATYGEVSNTYVSGYGGPSTASYTVSVDPKTSYAVTFNANGGNGAPAAQTKWYGETLTISATKPTRSGYIFKGWATSSTATTATYQPGDSYTTNAALSLYAVWQQGTYTIAYAANGGSSTPASQTKTHGVALTLRPAISRANGTASYTVSYSINYSGGTNPSSGTATKTTKYTFAGWKATNGTVYAGGASYTTNAATTMTAQWTSSASTTSVTLPTTTRTGYTFGGWYKESACTNKVGNGGASYTPTASITLYAKWTINTWAVSYNANGGTGAPASQTKTYNQTLTLSSTRPTRSGYTFLGWSTNAAGTGTAYAPGGSYTANAAATLYAVWVAVQVASLSAYRSNSAGTRSDSGTYGHLSAGWKAMGTIAGTVAVTATANDASVTSSLSNRSGSKTATADLSNTSVGTFGGSYAQDAAVRVSVTATLTVSYGGSSRSVSATRVATIPKVFRLLDALHGGTGLAIGTIATLASTFEVALNAIFRASLRLRNSNINRDGTAPSSATWGDSELSFQDMDGERVGYVNVQRKTNGGVSLTISGEAEATDGTDVYESLELVANRDKTGYAALGGSHLSVRKVLSTARGVSYIAGANGDAALYAPKSTTNQYYPAVCLDTNGGGSWSIGNYNDEALEFVYATKANRDSNTNTVSKMKLLSGNGTIYTTVNKPTPADIGAQPAGSYVTTNASGAINTLASTSSQQWYVKGTVSNSSNTARNGNTTWLVMNNGSASCWDVTAQETLWTTYTTANKPTPAAIGAIDDITTRSKTVSLPANSSSVSVAAPSVSGYTFVCWLQVAGSGHTNPGYMQDPKSSTTNLWSAVGSTTGARNWLVTALYKK